MLNRTALFQAFIAFGLSTGAFSQEPEAPAPEPAAPSVPEESNDTTLLKTPLTDPVSDGSAAPDQEDKVRTYRASFAHYLAFREDIDPFTVFDFGFSWKLPQRFNFGISQRVTKLYSVPKDDPEWQAADTALNVNHTLEQKPAGFDLRVAFGLTLPVSEFSQRQDVYSKPKFSLGFGRKFFADSLDYRGVLAYQYNISEYKTTKTGRGTGGGSPLRESLFVFDNTLAYKLIDKLSTSVNVAYNNVRYYDVGYRNRVSASDATSLFGTEYSFTANLMYEITPEITAEGGFSQSDAVEKTGGIQEAYLFDQYTSQWYFAMGAAF